MKIKGRNITDLELDVWRLIAMGLTRKKMAQKLCYETRDGPAWVTRSLYRKIGAHCAADATRLAIQYGVITVEPLETDMVLPE